jgi:hypothetical protein
VYRVCREIRYSAASPAFFSPAVRANARIFITLVEKSASLGVNRRLNSGSVVGYDTSQRIAWTATSKRPTPWRRGCNGLTRAVLWKAFSIRLKRSKALREELRLEIRGNRGFLAS